MTCPGVVAPPPNVKLGAEFEAGAEVGAGEPNRNPPVGGGPEGVREPEAGALDPKVKEVEGADPKLEGAGADGPAAAPDDGGAPKVNGAGDPEAEGVVEDTESPKENFGVELLG